MSITHNRELWDIADKYCGGYLHWTTRSNIDVLRDNLNCREFDGGSSRHRCRRQQHGAPATDVPGPVKCVMDAMFEDFKNMRLPAHRPRRPAAAGMGKGLRQSLRLLSAPGQRSCTCRSLPD